MSSIPISGLPTKWAICDCCQGEGRVDHPAFSNGITSEDWAEMQVDYDERDNSSAAERYMRGDYDVLCKDCEGTGKVLVPDMGRMTFAQKRLLASQRREEREDAYWESVSRAESAAERRMGA